MAPDQLTQAIDRRLKGAIRSIMTTKERVADPHLTADASVELRRVILAELNELAGLASALINSTAADAEFNELWVRQIEEIHQVVTDGAPDGG